MNHNYIPLYLKSTHTHTHIYIYIYTVHTSSCCYTETWDETALRAKSGLMAGDEPSPLQLDEAELSSFPSTQFVLSTLLREPAEIFLPCSTQSPAQFVLNLSQPRKKAILRPRPRTYPTANCLPLVAQLSYVPGISGA